LPEPIPNALASLKAVYRAAEVTDDKILNAITIIITTVITAVRDRRAAGTTAIITNTIAVRI
jgi:hypothetical protein